MIIIVDKNEQDVNKKLVEQMKEYFKQIKAQVIVTNLPHREYGDRKVTAGDVNIPLDDGNILAIERKTPDDFLGSIPKRHIFDQVEVMAQNAKYSAIIVTGYFTYSNKSDMVTIDGEKTEWTGVSVRAAINTIQYAGCPVIFCPPNEYCNQIVELYKLVNKGNDKHQGVFKNRIFTFPPTDERLQFLAQFPGIGIKLADTLLRFAGKMDKNADKDGYGTLASALSWMTILSQIDKQERPKGWDAKLILTQRKFLGLAANECLIIHESKD